MKTIILIMALGASGFNTHLVSSVDECKQVASVTVKTLAQDFGLQTWGKSASFKCVDAATGKELVSRTYLDSKGNAK